MYTTLQYYCTYVHYTTVLLYIRTLHYSTLYIHTLHYSTTVHTFTTLQYYCTYVHYTTVLLYIHTLHYSTTVHTYTTLQYYCTYVYPFLCIRSLEAAETILQTDQNLWLVYRKSGQRQFAVFFQKGFNFFDICGQLALQWMLVLCRQHLC